MKEGKDKLVPFWQKGVVIICIGCMLMFGTLVVTDLETVFGWANVSRTNTASVDKDSIEQAPHSRNALLNVSDDPSCFARTQHLLYRRDPQRFAPSAALEKAWERYALMHKACTHKKNWTHVFVNERDKNDDCNYLIVLEGVGGLGNKLLSLTSAFSYALATDRIVLVEGRNQFKGLLCDPFPGSSWFLPPDFPYQNVSDAPGINIAIEKDYKDVDLACLHLDHIQSWADQQFFCDHTHFKLMSVRWVGWTSNQYYVTRMFMVPSIWERLNPLFGPNEVFTQLSHRILLPRNELWAHIVRLYLGYLAGSAVRVGVQVRLHGRMDLAAFDPVAFDRIVDCLQSHKILPKLRDEEDVADLMSFAKKRWEGDSEISVLVTSLQLRYYDEMKDLYAGKPNENNTIIRFHMVSHLESQDGSMHQSHIAFVEMWLLSFSDVLAISAYSTFGYIPQGIGGLRPLILNIRGEADANSPSCFEGQSTQPCTHAPMKPECKGSNVPELHTTWMRHHLRECQDQAGGLQLVEEAEQPNNSTRLWEHIEG